MECLPGTRGGMSVAEQGRDTGCRVWRVPLLINRRFVVSREEDASPQPPARQRRPRGRGAAALNRRSADLRSSF